MLNQIKVLTKAYPIPRYWDKPHNVNAEASKEQKEEGLVKNEKANSFAEYSTTSPNIKIDEPVLSSNIGKKTSRNLEV
jgi:hypothetical protein